MTTQQKKPELLAPAGGWEQLEYALAYGADAVYAGGVRFGLRTRADNFDDETLRAAVALTHEHGASFFVTANAVMHPGDMHALAAYAAFLEEIGADAVLVSDLGAFEVFRRQAPHVALHVSTQASVANAEAALRWYAQGAQRVVLARELSLREVARIRAGIPDDLELEVFVHGAMCMAYSGRCMISAYLTGRDANRGACTQPCRWKYALEEEKRPGRYLPIEEDGHGTYLLDSRDLCMIEHLDELQEAGVDSFKIEGRMKGAYYVATVVDAYRRVLDGGPAEVAEARRELDAVSHRPYGTGFFFGPAQQNYDDAQYTQTHDLVAVTAPSVAGRLALVQRNRFFGGDTLEIMEPGCSPRSFAVTDLRDETGALADTANRVEAVYTCAFPAAVAPGLLVRRRRDDVAVKG